MNPLAQTRIHDADAHIFETADWLIRYADPDERPRLKPLDLHGQESAIARGGNRGRARVSRGKPA